MTATDADRRSPRPVAKKMPVDLNSLTKGWLELESDPGLFTLLLEDFGVKGVQVEEIYDLQKPIEGPVYGFIFLFKWIEERRSRRKIVIPDESCVRDDSIVNSIFFAHQIVPNSCATHALLSVLLNCDKIYLGETLTRLKEYTYNMSPENKGYAIGNTPELARAHNSHARPEPRRIQEKLHGFPTTRTVEAFHFVSYVPINGQLFELDGLKPYPIDHGPWGENEDWTETFRKVITERLGIATGGEPYHDIRFNLMAVVPDRRIAYEQKLKTLKINRQIVLEALQQLVKVTNPQLTGTCNEKLESQAAEKSAAVMTLNDNSNSTSSTVTTEIDVSTSAAFMQPSTATNPSSNCSTPTRMRGSLSRSTSSPSSFGPLHPALYSHNYAKSPLMEGQMVDDSESRPRYEQYSGSEYSSDDDDEDEEEEEEEEEEDDDDEDEAETASSSPTHNSGRSGSNASILPPPRLIHSGPGSGCPLAPNTTSPIPLRPIHVNTKDFSKPLSIQTKFETSPTPSCSSTDTSSEVGSAFNSPVRSICFNSAQNSPNFTSMKDFKRFVVIRVSGGKDAIEESPDASVKKGPFVAPPPSSSCAIADRIHQDEATAGTSSSTSFKRNAGETGNEAMAAAASKRAKAETLQPSPRQEVSSSTSDVVVLAASAGIGDSTASRVDSSASTTAFPRSKESPKYPQLIEPHTFAPKDLLALLKNIETEIVACESTLKDEVEKQNKYRIDDCRRTHNYDSFVCTFLSMLEGHGLLADLVEQHMMIKRRQGINIGRLHKVKKVDRKRKARARRRK